MTLALAYDKGTGPIDLAAHLNERAAPKGKGGGGGVTSRPGSAYSASKEEHDRHYFKGLYSKAHQSAGNVTEMSKRAGLNRETVRIYLKELGIGAYGS